MTRIGALIDAWEAEQPQAVALSWMERGAVAHWTRAQMAHAVRAARGRPRQRVWIDAEATPQALAAALGVLYHGGSVLPLRAALVPPALDVERLVASTAKQGEALVGITSGSTGQPHAVLLSERALLFSAGASARRLPRGVLMRAAPALDRLQVYTALTAIRAGVPLAVGRADVSTIDALGVTTLRATPSTFARLREAPLATVRWGLSSGAPLAASLALAWQKRGIPLLQHYGCTETGVLALHGPRSFQPDTVGRVARGVRLRLEGGEIVAHTPGLMLGYEDQPRPDTWFNTGDLGEIGADGHLRLLGRTSDRIVTSRGHKIVPGPVETALASRDGVLGALLLGDGGPWPVALLAVERTPSQHVLDEALAAFAPWQRPPLALVWPDPWPDTLKRPIIARRAAPLLAEAWKEEWRGVRVMAGAAPWAEAQESPGATRSETNG